MIFEAVLAPLIWLLNGLLRICYKMSGSNPQLAIGLFSLVFSLIMNRTLRWSVQLSDNEREIQSVLKPQIQEILSKDSGSSMHKRIAGLYRRYSYYPVYRLRPVVGCIIILAVLWSTCLMLQSSVIIQGQTFFGIGDMGKPDAVVNGTHILPAIVIFAHLAIVFLSGRLSGKHHSEDRYSVVLPLVFYNGPSALFICWCVYLLLRCARLVRRG